MSPNERRSISSLIDVPENVEYRIHTAERRAMLVGVEQRAFCNDATVRKGLLRRNHVEIGKSITAILEESPA